ncbi:hypothetical protein ACHAW5_003891 [Stephanodiscus triporus]|uniref:Thioredoxin domain-containing protein n=1 Tax=Stephanodiscus triporus TaxID=2934178 RepID=A0ABD3MSL8_9STRA
MEEERERKNSDEDDENENENGGVGGGEDDRRGEWRQVVGGFVPKFLRRRTGVVAASASASDAAVVDVDARPTILSIDTLEEYKRVVVDERESIVVVRFHAPWCKSCRAAYPHFCKLASDHHGGSDPVKFVEVPLTRETAYIHEGLGVPSVPYGHIYHPDVGLVEERKINRKEFGEFRSALESYVRGCCYLPEEEEGGGV